MDVWEIAGMAFERNQRPTGRLYGGVPGPFIWPSTVAALGIEQKVPTEVPQPVGELLGFAGIHSQAFEHDSGAPGYITRADSSGDSSAVPSKLPSSR